MVFFKKIIVNKIWKGESKLEGLNAPIMWLFNTQGLLHDETDQLSCRKSAYQPERNVSKSWKREREKKEDKQYTSSKSFSRRSFNCCIDAVPPASCIK